MGNWNNYKKMYGVESDDLDYYIRIQLGIPGIDLNKLENIYMLKEHLNANEELSEDLKILDEQIFMLANCYQLKQQTKHKDGFDEFVKIVFKAKHIYKDMQIETSAIDGCEYINLNIQSSNNKNKDRIPLCNGYFDSLKYKYSPGDETKHIRELLDKS